MSSDTGDCQLPEASLNYDTYNKLEGDGAKNVGAQKARKVQGSKDAKG